MAVNETYNSLLLDYASGALDEAFALVIAAHIALSPNARRIVHEYESIGGGLLHECCDCVPMKQNALQAVMEKLDCAQAECDEADEDCKARCAEAELLPVCLRKYMEGNGGGLPWKSLYPGLKSITVKTSCRGSKAEMLRLEKGAFIPRHTHRGYEITLILDGALHDQGQIYSRGDIIIHDDGITHQPSVDRHDGCLCLIVRSAPVQVTGLAGKIIGLFSR